MEKFVPAVLDMLGVAGRRLLFAGIVLIAGKMIIKTILRLLAQSRLFGRVEATVRTFTLSFLRIGLYVLVAVSVIGILGVPMASIVTVLASAGVAVGLALQGALSNLAGGIMLMIFQPFRQGDYVETAGVEGVVRAVTIFYTVLVTYDNKSITVPNGTLMNANVINYSAEKVRRVDMKFTCARTESPERVRRVILEAIAENDRVLTSPAAPFAGLTGMDGVSMEFSARVWCETPAYWDVYNDLMQRIAEALRREEIPAPTVQVVSRQAREHAAEAELPDRHRDAKHTL